MGRPEDRLPAPAEARFSIRSVRIRAPLPPPELLRRYDEVVPGAADRILTLAEEEQRHQAALSRGVSRYLLRGQLYGMLVCFAALGVVAFTAYLGHAVVAAILGGTTLTGVVTTFIVGRRHEASELRVAAAAANPPGSAGMGP